MIIIVIHNANATDEKQWEYILSNFQSDKIYIMESTHECTGTVCSGQPHVQTISDVPEAATMPVICLTPFISFYFKGTKIPLQDFVHPTDAIYVFGPNNTHLDPSEFFPNGETYQEVYIPNDTNDEMFSQTVYAVTMWDRLHG
jgi:hypothetical protein